MFRDRRELAEKRKKYGYAVPDNEIYDGLDVVVLQSRGDHIEQLLTELEIEHRMTQASQAYAGTENLRAGKDFTAFIFPATYQRDAFGRGAGGVAPVNDFWSANRYGDYRVVGHEHGHDIGLDDD